MRVISQIRDADPDATHHCYAFRLGPDENDFRFDDDGEPRGTAGPPILRQIDSFGLTDSLVVVTRYYGGTKLGAGGLIRAYGGAARETLETAELIQSIKKRAFRLEFPYSQTAAIMSVLSKYEVDTNGSEYNETTTLEVNVSLSNAEDFTEAFKDATRGKGLISEV